MENNSNKKISILELESLRSELVEKTFNTSSNNLRLFLYQNYFEKILSLDNPNFEEAFLKEFIDDYTNCVCKFEVWGVEPEISKMLLSQFKKVFTLNIASEYYATLNSEIDRIQKQLEKLNLILEGKDNVYEYGEAHKAFFPLIDKDAPDKFYGVIDSVTVRISKSSVEDKFIIIPSEKDIEKRIDEQIKRCWKLTLDISKIYVKKTYRFHEVIINFDKRLGFYEGNSLGIALTVSFLEQLLKYYNPVYLIKIKEQSAFTGGVTETGEVLCTSEEIIKRKVAAIFFSEIDTFVFPKCEETYAYFALTQLKKTYQGRKLKLIPVEDISDIINRRDVVDIKKQKLIVRSGKFVKKNWISTVATVLLAILFAYLFVMDFDNNPAFFEADGQSIIVKNKNGKLLWKRHLQLDRLSVENENYLAKFCKLLDVNSDGISEVLIANEQDGITNEMNTECALKCYDKYQNMLWKFSFKEKVSSLRDNLDSVYSIYMIDTLTLENQKALYLIANNGNSFSSAIFSLNLKTGKKNPGAIWCSGHTYDGLIRDINGDKIKDILCIGLDNGFEDVMIFGFENNSQNRVRPSLKNYTITNFTTADFITLIRIPKTDYDFAIQNRFQSINIGTLNYLNNTKEYYFALDSDEGSPFIGIWYKLTENLKDFNISVDNKYRVKRDNLVSKGMLNPPYSDTKEFEDILKDEILYWNGITWLNRESIMNK